MSNDPKAKPGAKTELNRRAALAKLGISVALAYSAPTIMHLDRSANATLATTPCSRGRNKPRWCRRKDRGRDHGNGHDKGRGKGHDKHRDRRSSRKIRRR
jgi:hypothetical protein